MLYAPRLDLFGLGSRTPGQQNSLPRPRGQPLLPSSKPSPPREEQTHFLLSEGVVVALLFLLPVECCRTSSLSSLKLELKIQNHSPHAAFQLVAGSWTGRALLISAVSFWLFLTVKNSLFAGRRPRHLSPITRFLFHTNAVCRLSQKRYPWENNFEFSPPAWYDKTALWWHLPASGQKFLRWERDRVGRWRRKNMPNTGRFSL